MSHNQLVLPTLEGLPRTTDCQKKKVWKFLKIPHNKQLKSVAEFKYVRQTNQNYSHSVFYLSAYSQNLCTSTGMKLCHSH